MLFPEKKSVIQWHFEYEWMVCEYFYKISIKTPWMTMATITTNWIVIALQIFIFTANMDIVCEQKYHKASIRNSSLSMQSISCHLIDWSMYPYAAFMLHLNCHTLRRTRLQTVYSMTYYTNYHSILPFKMSSGFMAHI